MENSPHTKIKEDEKSSSSGCRNKRCDEDMKNNIQEIALHASHLNKSNIGVAHEEECVADNVVVGPIEDTAAANKSTKQGFLPPKPPLNVKKEQASGVKRSASRWIDTRTRQELKVGDPHDDFLDAPIENVQNLNAEPQELMDNLNAADKSMDDGCFDEETVDIKSEIVYRKHPISVIGGPSNKSFKFVEPVRRKVERENLKGVERDRKSVV